VVQVGLDKKRDLVSKITREKGAAGMTPVIGNLPSKHEAFNSNSKTAPNTHTHMIGSHSTLTMTV
jgi:hypothetical protein